jgi:hypothetical protein
MRSLLISAYTFYESDFKIVKLGFELLASRGDAQILDDLECLKSAIIEKLINTIDN